ncbi:G-protein coupled receptor GRL101-like [Tubulanus polymorphus]|uniref:G-protein coupled receptor GRL101-like n=1 Tax=Tubulanus polymorphus TaxID=672921 RepID=UPI003DA1DA98
MAIIGNIGVVISRVIYKDFKQLDGFLIMNLAVSDLLMGIYLVIIASVDVYYRGIYTLNEKYWKRSVLCKISGILSSVSSEVSVFVLLFMTCERCATIKFPFRKTPVTRNRGALIMALAWIGVFVIFILPVLKIPYFGNEFYSNSGLCLPFVLTDRKTKGWEFSAAMFIYANLVAFIVIFVCYVVMYKHIRATGISVSKSNDIYTKAAKRMAVIVLTDFMAWIPIIVLGLLAMCNVQIPGEVYSWVATFVIPINSAINPFLYTFSVLAERRRIRKKRQSRRSFGHTLSTDTTRSGNRNPAYRDDSIMADKTTDKFSAINRTDAIAHSVTIRKADMYSNLASIGFKLSKEDVTKIGDNIGTALGNLHSCKMAYGKITLEDIIVAYNRTNINSTYIESKNVVISAYLVSEMAELMANPDKETERRDLVYLDEILKQISDSGKTLDTYM